MKSHSKKAGHLWIVCLSAALFLSACTTRADDYQNRVASLYIYNQNFDVKTSEFLLDFDESRFYSFSPTDHLLIRISSDDNQGYTTVAALSPERVDAFFRNVTRYGLWDWKPNEADINILGDYQWGMVITFRSGETQTIYCRNAFPDTWENVREAFETLTGNDSILRAL